MTGLYILGIKDCPSPEEVGAHAHWVWRIKEAAGLPPIRAAVEVSPRFRDVPEARGIVWEELVESPEERLARSGITLGELLAVIAEDNRQHRHQFELE
jgi:hypothetical protein